MATWKALITTGVRVFFNVVDSGGALRAGLPPEKFAAVLLEPSNTASVALPVSESSQKPGVYFVDLPSSFLSTHGNGQYGLSVEVIDTTVNAASLFSVDVTREDIDNLVLDGIVDGFLDRADAVETGVTWRQGLRAMAAILGGLVTGGPGNPAFRRLGGNLASASRVTVTADANGNRSIVILDL